MVDFFVILPYSDSRYQLYPFSKRCALPVRVKRPANSTLCMSLKDSKNRTVSNPLKIKVLNPSVKDCHWRNSSPRLLPTCICFNQSYAGYASLFLHTKKLTRTDHSTGLCLPQQSSTMLFLPCPFREPLACLSLLRHVLEAIRLQAPPSSPREDFLST